MTHPKIKVVMTTASQWNSAVTHARNLGAVSRDGQYGFNADKSAMIIDNNYIKYSSPTMKTVAGHVAPTKISLDEFLSLRSLHDANRIGQDCGDCAAEVAMTVAICEAANPVAQENLVLTACTVLEQNAITFKTVGLPALRALGVQVTMHDDVPYIIDVANNDAKELTPATVAVLAKADLLEGKVTAYTRYAKQFQLISDVTHKKIVEA